jgi:aconitate hydratase
MTSLDSFKCARTLKVGTKSYIYYSLPVAEKNGLKGISRLPFSMKVLLENLLRNEDGRSVSKEDIQACAQWLKTKTSEREIAFRPARVLMQDFTGVPAVVDLAAMRDAMKHLGGDPKRINPLVPVDLVIDHSVAITFFGDNAAFAKNVAEEYKQNAERYRFLKWAQGSFEGFRVVPPGTGICHQVNLEYLSQTVFTSKGAVKIDGKTVTGEVAYPDTVVGTDSHTTMVNGLAVLGWGVGGIEAEAAMLGQPYSMVLPEVIGVKLSGKLKEGVTATDLVLTVTQMLRKRGVVGKFVEFFGPGLSGLTVADRATLGNMSPEYGATCGFFPVDDDTIDFLRSTARPEPRVALVVAYTKAQGMYRTKNTPDPVFTDVLKLELSSVEPSRRLEGGEGRVRGGDGQGVRQGGVGGKAGAGRRPQARSRPWRRGDRGDHVVHQHLEPDSDGRRRLARPQRTRQGPHRQAVGQDVTRARLPGGRRVSRQVRAAEGPRQARIQSGRLWLHHLHRQFRAVAAGDFQGHQRQ